MDFSLNQQSKFRGVLVFAVGALLIGSSSQVVLADDSSLESAFQQFVQIQDEPVREEVQLARVTTDMATGHSDFKMVVDADRSIVSMRYYLDNGTRTDFTVDQIRAGVVMVRASGHDVLKLKGDNFDAVHGGHLILTYLNNGITNHYENFPIDLIKTGDHWAVSVNDQSGRHEFTTMFFKGKRAFGQWVGIDKITVK